jgi:CBS domain containing-hemolysin-like protein
MLMSGMEAGVFALNRFRIRHLMRLGDRRARLLCGYLESPERFLWTLLVGNTLANVAVVTLAVAALVRWLWQRPGWLVAALVGGMLAFYTVCELFPKTLFRLHPNPLCLALVRPFRLVELALRPVVAPLSLLGRWVLGRRGGQALHGRLFANREELRSFMQESASGLTSTERTLINRVLDLQYLSVRSITTPLSRVAAVAATAPVSEVLALARARGFNRFPVWDRPTPPHRIVGVVSVRTLLYEENLDPSRPVAEYVRPALYLDDHLRLEVALKQLQQRGHRLAVVLGPDQREVGIVSLEDILKVIFGKVEL